MPINIGATGVPLPPPQALFPTVIAGTPGLAGTNRITLVGGQDFLIPPGKFLVSPGVVSQVQINDPVTQTWAPFSAATVNEPLVVDSDGVNYRIINPTGFPIGAVVTASGTGFTSAPAVAAATGGSTWVAIVGGSVSSIVPSTGGSGAGYLVPPNINIGFPPAPGVPATATCTISGGSIASITVVNPGAGYTSAPAVIVTPQQSDTNFFSLTSTTATKNATVTAALSFAGNVTAVLLTNEGNNPLNVAPALTFSGGGGSGAAATAVLAQSIQSIAVTTGGSGYVAPVGITTFGGSVFAQTSGTGQQNNTSVQSGLLVPRQAMIAAAIGSGSGIGVTVPTYPANGSSIIDPGLFTAVPTAYAVPGPLSTFASQLSVNSVFTLTMGAVSDTVFITPL